MNKAPVDHELETVLEYLRLHRNVDFTGYKRPSLGRRIHKRMREVGVSRYANYIDYLEVHPEEFEQLFDVILINVTRFYRDQEAWAYIAENVVPKILETKNPDDPVRVWCAGVASGEEAYTIAIILAEALGEQQFRQRVKIYATDLDENALGKARAARYSVRDVERVPAEKIQKYFENGGAYYDFHKDLRRSVIFGRHDLTQDAPISRIDLLICRNTMIYFNSETQARVLARFHFALRDTGYLFLGKAEMLLTQHSLFKPVDLRWRVFSKSNDGALHKSLQLQFRNESNGESEDRLVQLTRLYDLVFEKGLRAEIVINNHGELVLANEKARQMFRLKHENLGEPFQDLPLSYQPVELRAAIDQARRERVPVRLPEVAWRPANGLETFLEVTVVSLEDSLGEALGVSVVFNDITGLKQLEAQFEQTNHDLETALEELQSTNEELETTNEELQSTIEELETTNEELQSTNEELETMNEELHSTNEELETMNEELRTRTDELNAVNVFLEAILASLSGGVVVLDDQLRVQIWNDQMTELWGLHATEVLGRRFFGLDIGLPLEAVREPILTCLDLQSIEQKLTVEAHNRRGAIIQCDITIRPLDHEQARLPGVIMIIATRNQRA